MCVHVVARRDGATHACVLWANKPLWCFRESLTAFCCSRQRLAAILCFLEPLPVAAAALGVSTLLPARCRPVLTSHWSPEALSRPLLSLIGQQQICPAPGGLSLVSGFSGQPLVFLIGQRKPWNLFGLSLVSGNCIPPLVASHWSAAAPSYPHWPLIYQQHFRPSPGL